MVPRGHRVATWQLLPSLARKSKNLAESEAALMKRFKQDSSEFLESEPKTSSDWLFLMQHHRVPTRLLDWSESALVGLYFAVEQSPQSDEDFDGCIWVMWPQRLNALSNIKPNNNWDLPMLGESPELDNYSHERIVTLTQSRLSPIAATARRGFRRVIAQAGVFTVIHLDTKPIEDMSVGKHLVKVTIPSGAKPAIRKELDLLNITTRRLFPELDRIGEYVSKFIP